MYVWETICYSSWDHTLILSVQRPHGCVYEWERIAGFSEVVSVFIYATVIFSSWVYCMCMQELFGGLFLFTVYCLQIRSEILRLMTRWLAMEA